MSVTRMPPNTRQLRGLLEAWEQGKIFDAYIKRLMPGGAANAQFENYRDQLGGANAAAHGTPCDWDTDTVRFILIDEGTITVSLSADIDFADLTPAGGRIGNSGGNARTDGATIASPTVGVVGVGVIDHALSTLTSVSGANCESAVYYKDDAADATSELLLYIDTVTPAFPVTPNGGNISLDPNASGLLLL